MAVLPPSPPHYTTEFRSDGLVNWPELELKYVNYQGVGGWGNRPHVLPLRYLRDQGIPFSPPHYTTVCRSDGLVNWQELGLSTHKNLD